MRVQIPFSRLIQKFQRVFIVNRNRRGSSSLIGNIAPTRLIHHQRCPAAAFLHRRHTAPRIGPLLLKHQFQILRMPIFQNLRIRTGISPVHAAFHQSHRTVQTCLASRPDCPDTIHKQLSRLQPRRICHINILFLVIQRKSCNDPPASDNRFSLSLVAVYYIVLISAAILFIQSQGFCLQIIAVCQNDFYVSAHGLIALPHQFPCPLQRLYRSRHTSVIAVVPSRRDMYLLHHASGRNRYRNLTDNIRPLFRNSPDYGAPFRYRHNLPPLVYRSYRAVVRTKQHLRIPCILRHNLCIDKNMPSCGDRNLFRCNLYPFRQYIRHCDLCGHRRQRLQGRCGGNCHSPFLHSRHHPQVIHCGNALIRRLIYGASAGSICRFE